MTAAPDQREFLRFNANDARQLLDRLDHIHLVAILPDAPKGASPHGRYFGSNVEDATEWASESNGNGYNIYWTVNYVGPGVGTKPKKSDIQAARGAHCDLDPPKGGGRWDKAGKVAELAALDLPPSLIIDSGNGVQPVWLLDQPERDWAPIERANIGLRDATGGDDCFNIDRLLRVPGSVNYPNQAKRQRGYVPCMSTWAQHDTGKRYTARELIAAFQPKATHNASAAEDFDDRVPTQTGALIAAIRRGENWHNNMLRLTAHLVAKQRTTVEILAMADCLTLAGWTVEETRETMRGMIADARGKWGYAEPDDRPRGFTNADTGEWNAYGPDDQDPGKGGEGEPQVGFPLLDLETMAASRATHKAFAIGRLVPLGEVTLFTGPGSAGKSLLAQQFATAAAAGLPCIGLPVQPAPALYLTCEDDRGELHWRQEHICAAMGIDLAGLGGKLHLVSLRGALGNELATFASDGKICPTSAFRRLCETLRATGAKLAFLDNVAHLFTGNENDRGEVTRFVNLLNKVAGETGAAIVLLGHPPKAGAPGAAAHDYSGSTAWLNAVRSQFKIDHDRVEGQVVNQDLRVLTVGKANYAQKGEAVRFYWANWAFVHEDELPKSALAEIAKVSRQVADQKLFLACLAERTRQRRAVSDKRSATFAPTVFASMPESKGAGAKRMEAAMEALIRQGLIERAELWRGVDRKPVYGLRETAGNGAADTMRETRETCQQTAENRAGNAGNTHSYTYGNTGAAHEAATPDDLDWPAEGGGDD